MSKRDLSPAASLSLRARMVVANAQISEVPKAMAHVRPGVKVNADMDNHL
ncbi:hypothetical protein OK016_22130 [Vibrio chagasii]|nr:hypothetical protein [Vibrio chagasii]